MYMYLHRLLDSVDDIAAFRIQRLIFYTRQRLEYAVLKPGQILFTQKDCEDKFDCIFYSYTDQTFHQFHDFYTELDLHRIMSGFHGAFATGVASQQGTLTLPDTWFRPPLWDLLMLQLLRPNSSNLPCLYSTFHFEYPLVLSRFCL